LAQAKGTQRQFNKLNTLESVIVNAEESAEDARWQQASIVVELLDGGMTQRQVAADWINGRTGKPYAQNHVKDVARVWRRFGEQFTVQERPDWTTAYYTVQQRSEEIIDPDDRRQQWSDAHEARAPKTERTAERLVQNLLSESPQIVDTVYQGLREGRENRYVEPQERERRRKEGEAYADRVGQPVRDTFSKLAVVLHLEQARDELRDMGSITGAAYEEILALLKDIEQEAEIKRAMAQVR
jgi:hypothetical protein